MHVLEPLRQAFGVLQVRVTAMLAVSQRAVAGCASWRSKRPICSRARNAEPQTFPHPLGFNLVPQVAASWTTHRGRRKRPAGRLNPPGSSRPRATRPSSPAPPFRCRLSTAMVCLSTFDFRPRLPSSTCAPRFKKRLLSNCSILPPRKSTPCRCWPWETLQCTWDVCAPSLRRLTRSPFRRARQCGARRCSQCGGSGLLSGRAETLTIWQWRGAGVLPI